MTSSASPTVRRRRLAAELRRLRGARTGTTVAKALGWSPAKVSRYELGQGTFPLEEIEKLLDYYGLTDPRRAQLLALAVEANEPAWWYEYADVLPPPYMEFIGLEAEAASELAWQVVRCSRTTPDGGICPRGSRCAPEGRPYASRGLRTPGSGPDDPPAGPDRPQSPLELSAVVDESVLLRRVGSEKVMSGQLLHLAEMARLPNVDLRILPLKARRRRWRIRSSCSGSARRTRRVRLGDVVTTEGIESHIYIEGETDTYTFRLFFRAFAAAALSTSGSLELILETNRRLWVDVADSDHESGGA